MAMWRFLYLAMIWDTIGSPPIRIPICSPHLSMRRIEGSTLGAEWSHSVEAWYPDPAYSVAN